MTMTGLYPPFASQCEQLEWDNLSWDGLDGRKNRWSELNGALRAEMLAEATPRYRSSQSSLRRLVSSSHSSWHRRIASSCIVVQANAMGYRNGNPKGKEKWQEYSNNRAEWRRSELNDRDASTQYPNGRMTPIVRFIGNCKRRRTCDLCARNVYVDPSTSARATATSSRHVQFAD